MDAASIGAAIGSLKATVDLARTAVAARDDAKIAAATQALNDRIIDVQNAALHLQEKQSTARDEIEALKDEARQLRAQIADLEKKRNDRSRYRLHEFPGQGTFVLALDESVDGAGPAHYICQPCMDNRSQKNVLQRGSRYGSVFLKCPSCEEEYYTGDNVPWGV